ncbi:MAG: histidinol dehydrogenase, partial [Bacteroidota bacterium]
VYTNPQAEERSRLLQRPMLAQQSLDELIRPILEDIRQNGDAAAMAYTAKFDGVELAQVAVQEDEITEAIALVSDDLKAAIQQAKANIERFHASQRVEPNIIETMPGIRCWQKSVAIEKVGLYIPGGTAPLFSTVLMLGVPAVLAGCREIVLCSPPNKKGNLHPVILYTAHLLGIKKIFKLGGAQAVAAMAYGTESVPATYKIFGPGNQYVTAAKQMVSREGVAIDLPAGPSEVLVLADKSAQPSFIAADLLSQAEHGIDSQVVLVSLDRALIDQTLEEIKQQLPQLPRAAIAQKALENSPAIWIADPKEALDVVNEYAPEHLIIATDDALQWAEGIENAGSVFLGHYTPESVGDYASGTNHTLPTNGYARAYSGVNLDAFVKKITYQQLTKEGLGQIGPAVELMAEAEALRAHKNAVSIRLAKLT